MKQAIKMAILAVAALMVGVGVGYLLGVWKNERLEAAGRQAEQRAAGLEQTLASERGRFEDERIGWGRRRDLLRAKEQLLRALVQLQFNNFGLASQHLAAARTQLTRLAKALKEKPRAKVQGVITKLEGVQTMTMRLDAMARPQIEQLIVEVEGIPGAR